MSIQNMHSFVHVIKTTKTKRFLFWKTFLTFSYHIKLIGSKKDNFPPVSYQVHYSLFWFFCLFVSLSLSFFYFFGERTKPLTAWSSQTLERENKFFHFSFCLFDFFSLKFYCRFPFLLLSIWLSFSKIIIVEFHISFCLCDFLW